MSLFSVCVLHVPTAKAQPPRLVLSRSCGPLGMEEQEPLLLCLER